MDIREEIIYLGKKMVREGLVASTWGNISGGLVPIKYISLLVGWDMKV